MGRAKRSMSYCKILTGLLLACLATLVATPSFAQDYPNRPVRVIVGNSAGSLADVVSRVVFAKVSELLGQQFLIDTRPGAGGTIAGEAVAKAIPDGYLLLFGSDSVMAIAPHLYTKLGYDPVKDFAGISMIAKIPYCIVVHPSLGVKSVEEFIRLAKARPGQINYSTGGIGHATHMYMEMFQWKAGIVLAHVPYKGTGPATQAVLTGEVGVSAMGLGPVMPHMQSGKLVGLAIGGPGSGPSDLAAGRFLGLTTQVPVNMDMAVPGRAPAGVPGITFHSRSYSRAMRGLRPAEVAVLEVLRMWPSGVEDDWEALRNRVTDLVTQGLVRTEHMSAAVAEERTPGARTLWHELVDRLTVSR